MTTRGTSILSRIDRLRQMSVADLRAEWLKLYGEPTRSRNKDFLFRRLAWRTQELARGGLADHVRDRLDDLAPDTFPLARKPNASLPTRVDDTSTNSKSPVRDIRMPTVGSVITKHYKARDLRVVVRDDGFEFDGEMYASLTAVAKAVTGSRSINGRLFWGITTRKR